MRPPHLKRKMVEVNEWVRQPEKEGLCAHRKYKYKDGRKVGKRFIHNNNNSKDRNMYSIVKTIEVLAC